MPPEAENNLRLEIAHVCSSISSVIPSPHFILTPFWHRRDHGRGVAGGLLHPRAPSDKGQPDDRAPRRVDRRDDTSRALSAHRFRDSFWRSLGMRYASSNERYYKFMKPFTLVEAGALPIPVTKAPFV